MINKSSQQSDFNIVRNGQLSIDISNTIVLLFIGHTTSALPAFIVANQSSYDVIGTLPATFSLEVTNNKLIINVGDTNYYSSEFKYMLQ